MKNYDTVKIRWKKQRKHRKWISIINQIYKLKKFENKLFDDINKEPKTTSIDKIIETKTWKITF